MLLGFQYHLLTYLLAVHGTPGLGRSNPVEESSFRSPILLVPETPKFREDSVGTVTASGHSTPEPETTRVLSPRTSPEVPDLTRSHSPDPATLRVTGSEDPEQLRTSEQPHTPELSGSTEVEHQVVEHQVEMPVSPQLLPSHNPDQSDCSEIGQPPVDKQIPVDEQPHVDTVSPHPLSDQPL